MIKKWKDSLLHSSSNGMKAVDLYIIYETKRRIKESVQLYFIYLKDLTGYFPFFWEVPASMSTSCK
jgi:hypothetical protein